MCSADQLVKELADVPVLLAAQTAAGLDKDEVIEALYRSWSSRLANTGQLNDRERLRSPQPSAMGHGHPNT